MQNARKPRVRQKNQRSLKIQKGQQGQQGRKKDRGNPQPQKAPQPQQAQEPRRAPEAQQPQQAAHQTSHPQGPRQPLPRPPGPRSEPHEAEPHGPEPHEAHPRRRPRPRRAPTGTARSHFPSRPAARLAGLTERAGRLADRLTPRTTDERALDLTLGTALLILTAPAVAVTALALTARRTPGGAWDRRPRTGLGGRIFELRTLRTRRFRLDVISRLPHVVRGELALVGPAPLPPGDPRAAGPGARQWRQELRPGLTGPAQLRARSGMPWDDPALLDQHYAEHHGVTHDLAILTEAAGDYLRTALPKKRRTKAHLSDTDHRPSGYSGVD